MPVGTLRIALQTPSDWRDVRELRLRALEESPEAFARSAEEERRLRADDWHERLAGPASATWMAFRDGRPVGLIVGADYEGEDGAAGLFGLWVDPEARGAGVGEELCRTVIDWARERGAGRVLLDVGDENAAAIRVYERLGFRRNGVTGPLAPHRTDVTEHQLELSL